MNKKEKVIIVIFVLVLIIPIALNEIKEFKLRSLKEETLKISEFLKNKYDTLTQIDINKSLEVDGHIYKTRGTGFAFAISSEVTVILQYKNYCSVKLPYLDEVALSKSKCQKLRVVKNSLMHIVSSDGLTKENDSYYYKGNADNYLVWQKELWRILEIKDNKIKVIKDKPLKEITYENIMDYLNNDYLNTLNKDLLKKDENNRYVTILSLDDYLKTLNDECKKIKNSLVCSKSFATKNMWLNTKVDNQAYYVYDDANIYIDSIEALKNIYPVLTFKESVNFLSGSGTIDDPYYIN